MALLDTLLTRLKSVSQAGVPVNVPQPTATQSSPTPPTTLNFQNAGVTYNPITNAYDIVTSPGNSGQTNLTLLNGLNSDIATSGLSTLRVGGPTGAFSIGGFTPAGAGASILLTNTTAFPMTIVNEDLLSTAAWRIDTQSSGASLTLQPKQGALLLMYDTTETRWIAQNVGVHRTGSYHVRDYGAKGDGSTDDTVAIKRAITAATSAAVIPGGAVEFLPGTYVHSDDITFPAGAVHKFHPGALLAPASGKVATFNGTIEADPLSQIFAGAGTVALGKASQLRVHPEWWGDDVQAAATAATAAAGGRGIEVVLQNRSYNLGSGSVGLSLSNHNARIRGIVEGEDTPTYSAAPGGTSGPGPVLVYSGSGTAVQVGSSGTLFTRNVRLETFSIQCVDATAKGLFVDGASYLRMRAVNVYGLSGNGNACLYLAACVSASIEKCRFNAQGTQTNPANYGVGIWCQSGVPTTTTKIRDCEIHLCYRGVYVNTAYIALDNCAIESCLHGLWAGPSANIRATDCHFENNGGAQAADGVTYESMVEVEATATSVTIVDPIVVMYPGQYLVAQVGTTGKLKVRGGTFTGGAVGTVIGATNASPIVVTLDGTTPLYMASGYEVTLAGVLGNTAANGTHTVTRIDDTHFSLNGTTGNGAWSAGGTQTAAAIPYLHNGSSETANSLVEWDGPALIPAGGGAPWRLQLPASRAVTGDVLNWQTCRFPKLQFRTYRFRATAVAGSASFNPPPSDGYAGGNFIMPAAGFLLGMTVYYSTTFGAGTIQVQGVQNGSTDVIDTGVLSHPNLPDYRSRGVFSVPFAKGDALSCFAQTVGLTTTGGDLEVEFLMGFGSGTF